jgi:putative phage-type endonuclease
MSTIMKLVQGSPEWHEHRRKYRNASETPIVLGVSPWQTPYQLWQHKLGLTEPQVTPPMLRGMELEPTARAAYEALTGQVMQPLVVVDGKFSASLDGLTLGGDRLVEIKCPFKGRDSTLWKTVEAGRLPEHYQWQLQHQLMVAQAAVADVFVFDGAEGIRLEITPTPHTWPQIHAGWDAFMRFVAESQAPPLTDRDTRVRDDPEWAEAALGYLEAKRALDSVAKVLDEAKAKLVGLANHTSESGNGVTVTRYWKNGTIDYKRIPELVDVELERYRGAAREEVRITAK